MDDFHEDARLFLHRLCNHILFFYRLKNQVKAKYFFPKKDIMFAFFLNNIDRIP